MLSPQKPFDVRERAFRFARDVALVFPRRCELTPAGLRAWSQAFNAASSTGAHLEEAAAAGTRRHVLSLNRGALREMREARFWLRLIKAAHLGVDALLDRLLQESNELVAIIATIVKNTQRPKP